MNPYFSSSLQGQGLTCLRGMIVSAQESTLLRWKFSLTAGQLRGRFKGHLQQVASKCSCCALKAQHSHIAPEHSLQDYISLNKSHFPLREKAMLICALLHRPWSHSLIIITTAAMNIRNTALNLKLQLRSSLTDS